MLADPISDVVKTVEARLVSLEAKLASFTDTLTSKQGPEHQLCAADDAGVRTCISKAQLDGLLTMMQAATIEPPAKDTDRVTKSVADVIEPAEAATAAPETKASAVEEPAKMETTTALEAPRQSGQAALDTREEDSMPTGSIVPESQGRALVTHPEVEITTPSTEN